MSPSLRTNRRFGDKLTTFRVALPIKEPLPNDMTFFCKESRLRVPASWQPTFQFLQSSMASPPGVHPVRNLAVPVFQPRRRFAAGDVVLLLAGIAAYFLRSASGGWPVRWRTSWAGTTTCSSTAHPRSACSR